MSETKLSLYDKIANIRRLVEVEQKTKQGYGYKYVPEEQILAKITAGLTQYNIDVYPSIVSGSLHYEPIHYVKTKASKGQVIEENVNEVIVTCEMLYTWIDLDTGETMEVPWICIGQQSGSSQAFGSALTYSNRYFFLKFFKVSTSEDDPDNIRMIQESANEMDEALRCKPTIGEIDRLVKEHLTDDNRAGFAAMLKQNIVIDGKPSANYRKISNIDIAEKTLRATKEFFNIA